MKPTFSIIIPIYNVEKYLTECLDSVFKQTYTCYEVICVEDASTDRSLDILEKYAKRDQIKLLINNQNKGLSYSRNRGLLEAIGEYVLFIDSDDYIDMNLLETISNEMESEEYDFITFDSRVVYDSDACEICTYNPTRKKTYARGLTGGDLYIEQSANGDYKPTVWQYCYRREFLNSNGITFDVGRYNEDENFSFNVFIQAKNTLTIPKVMHSYRIREKSIMSDINLRTRLLDNIDSFAEILADMIESRKFEGTHSRCAQLQVERWCSILITNYCRLTYEEKIIFDQQVSNDYFRDVIFNVIVGKKRASMFCKEAYDALNNAGYIYIFGAGKYAQKTIDRLKYSRYKISGIVVSDISSNPTEYNGYKVNSIESVMNIDDALIIIAVAEKKQSEVLAFVNHAGLMNTLNCKYVLA